MPSKLPNIKEEDLTAQGLKVVKYVSYLRPGFDEMKVGDIFGFQNVTQSSLYATKSSKQIDSFGEKNWKVLGLDLAKRVFFVKRIS